MRKGHPPILWPPRDLCKSLVVKFVAVISGVSPSNNDALGVRPSSKFYAFIVVSLRPPYLDGEHPRCLSSLMSPVGVSY
jgi:hypothetical protein